MAKTYSIGELAREFDITTRTIRFYESEGLISPERQGQTRIYSEGDRVRLKLILRGKRLGLSLAESREIVDLYDPASGNRQQLLTLIDRIDERLSMLNRQMADIHLMQTELADARKRCEDALK